MTRIRLYSVSAVVIRQRELGEADRILVLYTRERGKVSAVAKGIRRSRSRLAGSLQLFSLVEVQLAAGRSLEVITQARSGTAFHNLGSDMTRFAHASYVAELLDTLTEEGLADPYLYDLLVDTLQGLDAGGDPSTLRHAFELKTLGQLGYGPELTSCASCGTEIGAKARGFSVTQGGVLCARCLASSGGTALSTAGLRALHELLALDMAVLSTRSLNSATREEIGRLMRSYVPFHVGRELRSAAFLATYPHDDVSPLQG